LFVLFDQLFYFSSLSFFLSFISSFFRWWNIYYVSKLWWFIDWLFHIIFLSLPLSSSFSHLRSHMLIWWSISLIFSFKVWYDDKNLFIKSTLSYCRWHGRLWDGKMWDEMVDCDMIRLWIIWDKNQPSHLINHISPLTLW